MGLFAGIGGIELGLKKAGHQTLELCEFDPAARAVLRKGFPDVPITEDVRDIQSLPPGTKLLCGGFPCQDLSQAGRTRGITGSKSGLVDHVFRLLRENPVPWVFLENVPFMLQLAKGRALEVIVSELEALGYMWAYRVVDTRAFGLPQRRRRVLIVASQTHDPCDVLLSDKRSEPKPADAKGKACGFYWTEGLRGLGWAVDAVPPLKGGSSVGVPSPPAILLPDGRVVTPDIRDAERLQGFDDGWTERALDCAPAGARWRMVGNAVSVPVAEWVGSRLKKPGQFRAKRIQRLPEGARWPTAAWNTGDGRCSAAISEWPKRKAYQSLEGFLKYEPALLSERATAGFLSRTDRAKLRFPPGFKKSVEKHLRRMRGER